MIFFRFGHNNQRNQLIAMASIMTLCDAELLLILSFVVDTEMTFDRVKALRASILETGQGIVNHSRDAQATTNMEIKDKFPLSTEQLKYHICFRRAVLSPACDLARISLINHRMHDLICYPKHSNYLLDGVVKNVDMYYERMGEVDECWIHLFEGLFVKNRHLAEAAEAAAAASAPGIKMRISNSDETEGYFVHPNFEHVEHDDEVLTQDLKEVFVSDLDRAAYLRSFPTDAGLRKDAKQWCSLDVSLVIRDPRFMHWILDLEGTPVDAKQRIVDVLAFADECLQRLRAPLYAATPPTVFNTCLDWCLEQCEEWREQEIDHVVPTMNSVVDCLVTHVVGEFDLGCGDDITRQVLVGGEAGWDDWKVCFSCQRYLPYKVCKVPDEQWPEH